MHRPEVIHALRYATESAKILQMEKCKQNFPHYFANAVLEKRSATDKDYYVPPSIADKCFVVTRTAFDEIGCKTFSCFSFKTNWENCQPDDPLQWILIGRNYEVACQQSCKEHNIDTEWIRGQCRLANPLKKAVASMPEKLFQRASRHVFHGGLDLVDGHLRLNQLYCDAYGLDYKNYDCFASGLQKFGEFLFGKTPIRAARVGNMKPFTKPLPKSFPDYLTYTPPKKRVKRAVSEDDVSEDYESQLHSFALEITKDITIEISEYAIEHFLKKKAPQLLTKSLNNLAVRIVLKNTVLNALKQSATLSLKAIGSAVGIVTGVYALYEVVSGIIDSIDPYDYLKVLDKEQVEKLNTQLDNQYFKDSKVRPELTPEFVWEYNILKTETDHIYFMVEKVEEYLEAIKTVPPSKYSHPPSQFTWIEKEINTWNSILFKCAIFIIIFLALLSLSYIHVWTCCMFFLMLLYQRN